MRILSNPIYVPYRPGFWEILLCAAVLSAVVAGIVVLIVVLRKKKGNKG